jgi:SAM-dependent methyltransferase
MDKFSNWVKYCLEEIPSNNGLSLDLACGKGRHSLYMALLGYNVIAVDINIENLNHFSGSLITKIKKNIEDVKNWPLIKEKFDVIVVTNFLNREIFPFIIKSIRKKGFLIYETFSEGQQKIGKPSNPDYILKSNELISLCSNMQLIVYEEIYKKSPSNSSYKQRIFARNV